MSEQLEALRLVGVMLKTGMPEYNTDDVLEVLEATTRKTMSTKDQTHEAIAKALTNGDALTHDQRALLLGLVIDDKKWQREYDKADSERRDLAQKMRETAEPVQEPLSDEELDRLWREPMSADWEHREFARAVEAAHGIKEEK